MKSAIFSVVIFWGIVISTYGQAAHRPFPHHTKYVTGSIKPSHVKQAQLDKTTANFYAVWKKQYVKNNCEDPSQYYILNDEENVKADKPVICCLIRVCLIWSGVLLPNLLIFGFIIPVFAPIVYILFIFGLFSKHADVYIYSYVAFFAVDWLISTVAYRYDHQKFGLFQAVMLFIQRFVYRQLLFYVLIKAYLKAIKGELANWGVLKRTGNVKG